MRKNVALVRQKVTAIKRTAREAPYWLLYN